MNGIATFQYAWVNLEPGNSVIILCVSDHLAGHCVREAVACLERDWPFEYAFTSVSSRTITHEELGASVEFVSVQRAPDKCLKGRRPPPSLIVHPSVLESLDEQIIKYALQWESRCDLEHLVHTSRISNAIEQHERMTRL